MDKRYYVLKLKVRKEDILNTILRLAIFVFTYISIRYAYPYFFPYYANGSFTIKLEMPRIILGAIGVVFIWIASKKEYNYFISKNRISGALGLFLNYLYFLPGMYMVMFYDREWDFAVIYFLYTFMFNIFVLLINKKEVRPTKHFFNGRDTEIICIIASTVMLAFSLYFSNFEIKIFNVFNQSEVYQTRAENDLTNQYYILWYFIIFGASIVPTWLVVALRKKQYFVATLYTFAVFAMYSVSCNRQYLFTLAFAYLIYYFRKNKNLLYLIFIGMWGLVVIEWVMNKGYFWSDIYRRLSLVPNVNADFHVDYFLENQPDYLRQALNLYANRLGFVSPYKDKIATMIGNVYYGTEINANTGLLGGNFANYGYASLIVGPCLYGVSLRILDKIFVEVKNRDIILATVVVIGFSITNSENWIELLLVPSWVLFYYLSLLVVPTQGTGEE